MKNNESKYYSKDERLMFSDKQRKKFCFRGKKTKCCENCNHALIDKQMKHPSIGATYKACYCSKDNIRNQQGNVWWTGDYCTKNEAESCSDFEMLKPNFEIKIEQ